VKKWCHPLKNRSRKKTPPHEELIEISIRKEGNVTNDLSFNLDIEILEEDALLLYEPSTH
jgi:hypothetical protein